MRVSIKNGVIVLPQDLISKIGFPKNGECEIEINEAEIRIKKPAPIPKELINLLHHPIKMSMNDIVKISENTID